MLTCRLWAWHSREHTLCLCLCVVSGSDISKVCQMLISSACPSEEGVPGRQQVEGEGSVLQLVVLADLFNQNFSHTDSQKHTDTHARTHMHMHTHTHREMSTLSCIMCQVFLSGISVFSRLVSYRGVDGHPILSQPFVPIPHLLYVKTIKEASNQPAR